MHPRLATLADTDELVRLAGVMFRAVGLAADDTAWQRAGHQRLRSGLADGSVAAFVVDNASGGGCVAAAVVSVAQRMPTPPNPGGSAAYVQWVATDAGHRRRGHARAVMEAVVAWCRDRGVGSVDLHASAEGEALYRELGFVPNRNPELRLFL